MSREKLVDQKEAAKFNLPPGNIWQPDSNSYGLSGTTEFRMIPEEFEVAQNLVLVVQEAYMQPGWEFDRLFASHNRYGIIFTHPNRNKLIKGIDNSPVDFVRPEMISPNSRAHDWGSAQLKADAINDILAEADLYTSEPSAYTNVISRRKEHRFPKRTEFHERYTQSGVAIIMGTITPLDDEIHSTLSTIGSLQTEHQARLDPLWKRWDNLRSKRPENPKSFPE